MKTGERLFNSKADISAKAGLAKRIAASGRDGQIQLMTHQIVGYPDFETNYEMIRIFHEQGIRLVELQLPFSEPIADGPVFLKANQAALAAGVTIEQCMAFAARVTADFADISFLFMTYYNIVFRYGEEAFVHKCAEIGIAGLIVPDAYPEECGGLLEACRRGGVEPVLIVTPYTPESRLARLASQTGGLLYCAARKGVTGAKTEFGDATDVFLARVRQYARTPIAVGFGIQNGEDIASLRGKCDIAVIGTQMLLKLEREGLSGMRQFIGQLQS
ncbi:MAG: tryptophan synthase susbunit alpha [Paenibacillus sp.]|nr:tryptophan synthase susbunit alpha [Paenibacillus sp.]